ncbi:MAG TPA: His/Gly/Thr/Pro-type tRNA ligase C-terminal domain-containing protein [Candidatus Doudnabacteria bacterium]|nr:His/Gly/Thr/Pro-type tRNA ligase C-terminal domain-containing protein [Candidatus Doudnabacteria bacterium]
MKQSQYFFKTSKAAPKDDVSVNARLLEQAGFIHKEMAGIYSYLPLGWRVLQKIENIIREEMNTIGAQEIFMPALQPKENWQATGRWDNLDVLFKVKSVHDNEFALGPTHEEIVTPLAKGIVSSYRDLPLAVYQIQTKFRDEARAKSGLMRGREFRMKDLYSFHANAEDLAEYYKVVAASYKKIFERLGVPALYTEASGGTFSKYSHEFQVETPNGEDTVYVCGSCSLAVNKEIYADDKVCTDCGSKDYRETKASEVGNIFELNTKYSDSFNLNYRAEDGSQQPVLMGCFGIGSSRIMGVIVEQHHDGAGIIWPEAVSPFKVHLVALAGKDEAVLEQANRLYSDLLAAGVEVLYDDRTEVSAGEKFADSDLLGIPYRLIISSKTMAENSAEIKYRKTPEAQIVPLNQIIEKFSNA